ncbi:MAG: hypothetical protein K1X64_18435 [Myxococcaceae bacterium]|nr:hypothetical protein [Myxococcaceae bacterium]
MSENSATRLKPFSGDTLKALLINECERGSSGELVVRGQEDHGRVFLVQGRIAWAYQQGQRETLSSQLVSDGLISDNDRVRVFEECRHTRRNFCEVLIGLGLVDRETVRERLRRYVAGCLYAVFSWQTPEALFIPQERKYSSDLLFVWQELLGVGTEQPFSDNSAPAVAVPHAPSPESYLEELLKQPPVQDAFFFEVSSKTVVASASKKNRNGETVCHAAGSMMAQLSTALGHLGILSNIADIELHSNKHVFIVSRLGQVKTMALVAVLEKGKGIPSDTRKAVAELASMATLPEARAEQPMPMS